jgi:hypothetical protein
LAQGQPDYDGGGAPDLPNRSGILSTAVNFDELEWIQAVNGHAKPVGKNLHEAMNQGTTSGQKHPVQAVHFEAALEEIQGPAEFVRKGIRYSIDGGLNLFG